MSIKKTFIRDHRFKSFQKIPSRLNITTKFNNELTNDSINENISDKSIHKLKVPSLNMKTIRSINEAPTSSRLRLAGLISTHTSTKLNLSINTPSNGTIKTSRIRGSDSFSIPSKRSIVYPLTAFQA